MKSRVKEEMEHVDHTTAEEEGGGFLPDRGNLIEAGPTAICPSASVVEYDYGHGGDFVDDGPDEKMPDVRYLKATSSTTPERAINAGDAESGGGGFLIEAEIEEEGEEKDIGKTAHDNELNCLEERPQALEQNTSRVNKYLNHEDDLDVRGFGSSYRIYHDLTIEELAEAEITQQIFEAESQQLTSQAGDEGSRAKNNGSSEPVPADYRPIANAIGQDEFHQDNSASKPQDEAEYNLGPGTLLYDTKEVHDTVTLTEESEIDKGSLLSHDPSDEEADPEWLA